MGEGQERALRLRPDSRIKLEFHGARVTSGAPEPRAVLNTEEDGLARSGRKASGKPWNPHSGAGDDC
jgi:hypothetical protein